MLKTKVSQGSLQKHEFSKECRCPVDTAAKQHHIQSRQVRPGASGQGAESRLFIRSFRPGYIEKNGTALKAIPF